MMPRDLPPWHVVFVYQQIQRWLQAGVFAAMVDDLRAVLPTAQGRNAEPFAVYFLGWHLARQVNLGR
jgi:transposase